MYLFKNPLNPLNHRINPVHSFLIKTLLLKNHIITKCVLYASNRLNFSKQIHLCLWLSNQKYNAKSHTKTTHSYPYSHPTFHELPFLIQSSQWMSHIIVETLLHSSIELDWRSLYDTCNTQNVPKFNVTSKN